MRIALCGNPNVGKTTVFNRLTRSDAPVGNWHGVTVDVRTKKVWGEKDVFLSDLPGTYSLTARTKEEAVTRDGILFGGYDVVIFVADVNNLRRNLYLFAQLAECAVKTVLVVNMMDEVRGKVELDILSKRLGVPVVGTSEKYANPKDEIMRAVKAARAPSRAPYASAAELVGAVGRVRDSALKNGLQPLFAAMKLTERDGFIADKLGVASGVCQAIGSCGGINCADCGRVGFSSADIDAPARLRYAYIDGVLDGVLPKRGAKKITDKIDKVVLGKLALPIFFAVMAAVFVITYQLGKPLSDLLLRLTELCARPLDNAHSIPKWAVSLLQDGVIGGVGAVIAFLPQVTLLFILTALLQDSGYMSRVAFVTDGFFGRFGLSGRAAFSMILGLGCSATAVLSSRGIADRTARYRAAFVTPFCPCSARLAVFTAVTAYFGLNGIVVAAMYVIGFAAALAVLKIMQLFKKSARSEELLMEMPTYRLPCARRVFSVVWRNVAAFVVRVGTVVLCVNVIMWVLSSFSVASGFGGGETSIMCTFASFIAPVFAPLGFGNWRAVAALISGVAAKETVVSVIASLGGMGEVFGSTAAAVSFLIFTCLYVPCAATLASLAKENGIKSAILSVAVHTVVAYTVSFIYYRSAMCYMHDKNIFYIAIAVAAAVTVLTAISIYAVNHVKHKRKKRAAA